MSPAASSLPNVRGAMEEQEVMFAQRLVANEKHIRDKALNKLQAFLLAKSSDGPGFTDDDALKIWKGLFYCMYMADKPLIQEEVAEDISYLLHNLNNMKDRYTFIKAAFQTFAREWNGIDIFRIDKFMMFMRRVLRQVFVHLKLHHWDLKEVAKSVSILDEFIIRPDDHTNVTPLGIKLHLCTIILQELAKIGGDEVDHKVIMAVIQPYLKILALSKIPVYQETVKKEIFYYLMRQTDVGMDYEEDFERMTSGTTEFENQVLGKEGEANGEEDEEKEGDANGEEDEEKEGDANGEEDKEKTPSETSEVEEAPEREGNAVAEEDEDDGMQEIGASPMNASVFSEATTELTKLSFIADFGLKTTDQFLDLDENQRDLLSLRCIRPLDEAVLDPRAGGVNVCIPQLKPDFGLLAKTLQDIGGLKKVSKINRALLYSLATECMDLAEGVYPLAIPEDDEEEIEEFPETRQEAVEDLKKFYHDMKEMSLKDIKKKLGQMEDYKSDPLSKYSIKRATPKKRSKKFRKKRNKELRRLMNKEKKVLTPKQKKKLAKENYAAEANRIKAVEGLLSQVTQMATVPVAGVKSVPQETPKDGKKKKSKKKSKEERKISQEKMNHDSTVSKSFEVTSVSQEEVRGEKRKNELTSEVSPKKIKSNAEIGESKGSPKKVESAFEVKSKKKGNKSGSSTIKDKSINSENKSQECSPSSGSWMVTSKGVSNHGNINFVSPKAAGFESEKLCTSLDTPNSVKQKSKKKKTPKIASQEGEVMLNGNTLHEDNGTSGSIKEVTSGTPTQRKETTLTPKKIFDSAKKNGMTPRDTPTDWNVTPSKSKKNKHTPKKAKGDELTMSLSEKQESLLANPIKETILTPKKINAKKNEMTSLDTPADWNVTPSKSKKNKKTPKKAKGDGLTMNLSEKQESLWANPVKQNEIEIFLKERRLAKLEKKKKSFGTPKVTPKTPRTIKINLKQNKEHDFKDYEDSIRNSPQIPYSADKVPKAPVLKPTSSPILVGRPALKILKNVIRKSPAVSTTASPKLKKKSPKGSNTKRFKASDFF